MMFICKIIILWFRKEMMFINNQLYYGYVMKWRLFAKQSVILWQFDNNVYLQNTLRLYDQMMFICKIIILWFSKEMTFMNNPSYYPYLIKLCLCAKQSVILWQCDKIMFICKTISLLWLSDEMMFICKTINQTMVMWGNDVFCRSIILWLRNEIMFICKTICHTLVKQ